MMISEADIDRIADGWIKEFSVDPYIARRNRTMDYYSELDDLIFKRPEDALLVFEKIAQKDMINWTFEGISVGPLRNFLILHEHKYDASLEAILRSNSAFGEMLRMALEGLSTPN